MQTKVLERKVPAQNQYPLQRTKSYVPHTLQSIKWTDGERVKGQCLQGSLGWGLTEEALPA